MAAGTTMSRSPCNTKSGAATRPMRDNIEAVAHQQHRRDKRVMALRGGRDAGEGCFEDEGGHLMPRGQVDGDARADTRRQHDFVRLIPNEESPSAASPSAKSPASQGQPGLPA